MKVLLVTGSYPPMRCGVGDYTQRLAEALAARPEIQLEVLTSRVGPIPANDPPWLHRAMPTWRIKALPTFIARLRRFRPQIVHLQYPTQGYSVASGRGLVLMPMIARWGLGAAVVQTWHELPPPSYTKAAVAMLGLAAAADAIVYVRPQFPEGIGGALDWVLGKSSRIFLPNASVIPVVRLTGDERAALRAEIGCDDRRLVSFFGFVYRHKGVDQLFQIGNPARDHLLIIGELVEAEYHQDLRRLANSHPWQGHVSITGFAEPERVARLLAASDAVVFPFEEGGGVWNSSLHAAVSQGTFVITTSAERAGYDPSQNIYYAQPGGIEEMQNALARYAGTRAPVRESQDSWSDIARRHVQIYEGLVASRRR